MSDERSDGPGRPQRSATGRAGDRRRHRLAARFGVTGAAGGRRRRGVGRSLRFLRVFFAIPAAIIAGFAALTALCIAYDDGDLPGSVGLRHALTRAVSPSTASSALQVVAGGMTTLTSITFSLLLVAVQQSAASLSPVIFDQFLRRRANQAVFGYFVGLTMAAFVFVTAAPGGSPPLLGAVVASTLSIGALALLVALVYGTVEQMRPPNVIGALHDRTLAARGREAALLAGSRRQERSRDPVRTSHRSEVWGYVTDVDVDVLHRALDAIPGAEIRLHVAIGDAVVRGQTLATVRDDDEADADWLARQVAGAVLIGASRDLTVDATAGIDALANIGWSAASSARHNPEVARQVLHALEDLARRLHDDDPAGSPEGDCSWALVYPDNDAGQVYAGMVGVVGAACESAQQRTAARGLDALVRLVELGVHPSAVEREGPDGDDHVDRRSVRDHLAEAVRLARQMPAGDALGAAIGRGEAVLDRRS
ncbi:MAG TPA: DUF2254 family protein [Acidimicrobiales bacterium]|nr:DUF2254 family protein [Acidimicrobiales bacterium]